ncbi:MAG: hypothetical protein KA010_01910 [Saprospiraceae bacterium]|nr:hypothetical protein [Saprospiraceae bacterium]
MRHSLALFLFVFFLIPSILKAQDSLFVIQLGTFKSPKISDFEAAKKLGYVFAQPLSSDIYQLFLGGFERKKDAIITLERVSDSGYPDAFISYRNPNKGEQKWMVLLSTVQNSNKIDWTKYAHLGKPIFTNVIGEKVEILAGKFDNEKDASLFAAELKENKSFVWAKTVKQNEDLIDEVTQFEAGSDFNTALLKTNNNKPAQQDISSKEIIKKEEKVAITSATPKPTPAPPTSAKPKEQVNPKHDVLRAKGGNTLPNTTEKNKVEAKKQNTIKPPVVSNNSSSKVMSSKEILKSRLMSNSSKFDAAQIEKVYKTFKLNNKDVKKYTTLAKDINLDAPKTQPNTLDYAILTLNEKPQEALKLLEKSAQPIAKAYRGYWLFIRNGASTDVDDLMNQSIKEAFTTSKKTINNFDAKSSYTYKDLDQIIRHLRYIYMTTDDQVLVPSWLFEEHKTSAIKAFEPSNTISCTASSYKLLGNNAFSNVEDIKIIYALLSDLSTETTSHTQSTNDVSVRNRIFFANKPLDKSDEEVLQKWNQTVQSKMNNWKNGGVLQARYTASLEVLWAHTQVDLEMSFLAKKISPESSYYLSLAVMQTYFKTFF